MKAKIYPNLLITLVIILFASCGKNDYGEPQNLIGRWEHPAYTDNVEGRIFISYERTDTLSSDGIEFKKNGLLIERKNAGWCGTPPVTYTNYFGNWHIQNEDIVINVAYWGGMEYRIWKIIDATNTKLTIEEVSRRCEY